MTSLRLHLAMLKLPGDKFVTVGLVHDGKPVDCGTDVSHLVVQVESMAGAVVFSRRDA